MAKEYFIKEKDIDILKDNVDNKISSPNTAEVGQILSVKAIDGNGKPTEWEVINKPGSGPGESSPYIYMTQEEYEALTEYEQDRMYWVTYPVSGGHLVWKNGEIISGDGTLNNYLYYNKCDYYLLQPRIILTYNLGYDTGNNVYRSVLSREKVTHVDIASTMTYIGSYCFGTTYLNDYNDYLKEVNTNKSIKSIDNNAFVNCSSLKSITIPDSVTSMGGGAFKGCSKLETVIIGNGLETIPSSTFSNCTALTTIVINKPQDSVSGAPWGATNATVVWTG